GQRGQDDRKLGREEIYQSPIRPHGVSLMVQATDAMELRRPARSCSASVAIRSTISAAGGISWISPTASPAITAAMSKLPAAFAAAYSAATAATSRISSTPPPIHPI